jgi:hypothetical protein
MGKFIILHINVLTHRELKEPELVEEGLSERFRLLLLLLLLLLLGRKDEERRGEREKAMVVIKTYRGIAQQKNLTILNYMD